MEKIYVTKGYVPIGVRVLWNKSKDKKSFFYPRGWTFATLDTYGDYFSKSYNGIALVTGELSDLYVIDCDIPKKANVVCGVTLFKELSEKHGLSTLTPIAQSPNGGRHYFFSLKKSVLAGLECSRSTSSLLFENKRTTIDTRGSGGNIVVEPTSYECNGAKMEYKWIKPLDTKETLPSMPYWCIRIINESNNLRHRTKSIKIIKVEALHTVLRRIRK